MNARSSTRPKKRLKGPSAKRPTEAGFREIARKFKLLGDPKRLKLIYLLHGGERTVGEVQEGLGCPQPTASRLLAQLQEGGLLARRQEGTTVYYRVADPQVFALCEAVCGTVEREQERASEPLFRES